MSYRGGRHSPHLILLGVAVLACTKTPHQHWPSPVPVAKEEVVKSEAVAGPPKVGDLEEYTKDLSTRGELTARIHTSKGTIRCVLLPDKAPLAVANFVGLARGLKAWRHPKTEKVVSGQRFYDGLEFHRVIEGFMIQGGDPSGTGQGGPGYKFENENLDGKFDIGGLLAMANAGKDTNGSQFFITENPTTWLNKRHTIFGKCGNPEVVKSIARVDKGRDNRPTEKLLITRVGIAKEI